MAESMRPVGPRAWEAAGTNHERPLPLYPFSTKGVFHIDGILSQICTGEFSRSKTPKFPARFTAVNEYLAFTPAGETVPIVTVCRPCQPSLAWRVRFATPRDFIKCLRRQAAPAEPVNLIASTLASHPTAIEEVSGLEVRLDLAREWTRSLAHTNIFGPWSVKVVNQLGRCSKDAQDMLLAYLYLNRMKPGHSRAKDPARQLGTNLGRLGSRTRRRAGLCAADAGHGIHLCRLQLSKREVVKTVLTQAELRCAEFILPR